MSTSSVMRILNSQGDSHVTWDYTAAQDGDPEAAKAIKETERIFNQARAQRSTAFAFNASDRSPKLLSQFDPREREILIVPRVIGG